MDPKEEITKPDLHPPTVRILDTSDGEYLVEFVDMGEGAAGFTFTPNREDATTYSLREAESLLGLGWSSLEIVPVDSPLPGWTTTERQASDEEVKESISRTKEREEARQSRADAQGRRIAAAQGRIVK